MSALRPTGERQEHLDATISCSLVLGRGGVCFEVSILVTCQKNVDSSSTRSSVLEEGKGPNFDDEWAVGSLTDPLARIKVDEKNCFGMIEWKAVREAASRLLRRRDGNIGTCPTLNRRVCRQCPRAVSQNKETSMAPECSLALGLVASETRGRVAAQQAAAFHGLELTSPQTYSAWHMDDGDIILVSPDLGAVLHA